MRARTQWFRILALLALAFLAAMLACGDNSSSWTPLVVSLNPDSLETGTTNVEVRGYRFAPGATAYWNGRRQTTRFSSNVLLQVQLDVEATLTSGVATLAVANEGGHRSNEISVTIRDAQLTVTSLSPPAVPVSAGDFTLTISGRGFVASSQVFWNGAGLQTQFSSSTELHAQVPAALVTVAGSGIVRVRNPARCEPFVQPPCTAMSNPVPCMIGVGSGVGLNVVAQAANNLVWDAVHGLVFLSVPADAPSHAGTISVLNPAQGTILASVAATDTQALAVSGDGQYLYAGHGPSTLTRYQLPGLTDTVSWFLGSSAGRILDVQVAPAAPRTAAVSLNSRGVVILDDGVPRPNYVSTYFGFFDSLQWGADATRLFAADGESSSHDFYVLSVDAGGAALRDTLRSVMFSFNSRIHYDGVRRRIYGDRGEVIDEQGAIVATFTGSPVSECVTAADGTFGKAFFVCVEEVDSFRELIIRSFDLTTHSPIATILLNSWWSHFAGEHPVRIVRWGTNGLLIATRAPGLTGDGKIYVYSGPFVH